MLKSINDAPKILFLDIEATNLNAAFGYMLCCGFKWLHEKKPFILDISQLPGKKITDDSELADAVVNVINQADIIVTYYGMRYDIPFINSRQLVKRKKNFVAHPDASHVDLWFTVRKKLKLQNNRLASVIDFLQLDNEKTPVKGQHWVDAMSGDRKALKYVVEHCRKDVLALEEAYKLILPLIINHPKVSKPSSKNVCPKCGCDRTRSKGLAVTTAKIRKQRRVCLGCGGYFFGNAVKSDSEVLA